MGEVFRDACRDMKQSLRWQLGGLQRAMDYLTDAPAYLEPWYGIGTAASAFGADYEWLPGQAPAVKPVFRTVDEMSDLKPRAVADVPILRYTLETIEYFLHETQGRAPVSWCDIQSPINVAGGLVDISEFLLRCTTNRSARRNSLRAGGRSDSLHEDPKRTHRPGAGAARARIRQRPHRHRHRPEHGQSHHGVAGDVRGLLRRAHRAHRRGVRRHGLSFLRQLGPLAAGGEADSQSRHGGRRVQSAD